MTESIVLTLLRMSIAGGLTCLLVYAAMRFTRKKIPAAWQFSIWIVAVLRLIVPLSADMPFDIPAVIPFESVILGREQANDQIPAPGAVNVEGSGGSQTADVSYDSDTGASSATRTALLSDMTTAQAIGYVWILGAFLMLGWYVVGYIATLNQWKKKRTIVTDGKVRVYECSLVATPVLVGLLRPCIYLPAEFPNRELAIRHELCHLQRSDIRMKWLVQLVVCAHWFNPLVYLMRYEMNRLAELACDQAVTEEMSDDARRAYGEMLIDTARNMSKNSGMLFAFSDRKQFLGERIKALMTRKPRSKSTIVLMSVLVICILSGAVILGSMFLGSGDKGKADDIDRPFVDDPDLIGTWVTVDFVKKISDFDPSGRVSPTGEYIPHSEELSLKEISFFNGGRNSLPTATWTKGYVLNHSMQTASKYRIKEIDGTEYLFFEWKSGDYTIRGRKPYYYVLKRSPETLLAQMEEGRITDAVDLPFVEDSDVIGTWKSVDAVTDIESFDPDNAAYIKELQLLEMTFEENGAILFQYKGEESAAGSPIITWTKSYVLDKSLMVSSKYIIKRIDDTDYMFFEWKYGDYTFTHVMPGYYVLKRE